MSIATVSPSSRSTSVRCACPPRALPSLFRATARAFVRAVGTLMDDPELGEAIGRVGHDRVEKKLQWIVVGKNLVTAYDRRFSTR